MATQLERWLRRTQPNPPGYNEQSYTGAEYAPGYDAGPDSNKEGPATSVVRQARQALRTNGIVFAVMAARQALLSEARFQYQAMTDGHLFGNTDLALLEHPWPNADSGELLSRMCQDGSLGNAYIRKAVPAGNGLPVLVQLRPERVTIISQELYDDQGRKWKQPVGYAEDISGGQGKNLQFYTTDEVAHFSPVPDPGARWRGMSWLSPVLMDVSSDARLTEYKTFHLQNGAMPGLVVKYSSKLSTRTVDTLRKRIRGRYGGPENAGNVIILDEGADLTVAGSSLQDLQFDAVTKAGERRVCAAGGPGMLVICGFEQGDYKTAIREFADLWARPWWRMICASLEHLIPTSAQAVPVRLWYDVSGIAALREGELERAQAFLVKTQGLASSIMAGMKRDSAIKAADTGDLSLLVPDPDAPPPGVSGRATERVGQGGFEGAPAPQGPGGQPGGPNVTGPTGGPAGVGPGRPPQAGRPQALPGVGRPNLPNAMPGVFTPMPALPGGARGRRSVNGWGEEEVTRLELPPGRAAGNGHGPALAGDAYDADRIVRHLVWAAHPEGPEDPPSTAAVDNEAAWELVRADDRFAELGMSPLEARMIAGGASPEARDRWVERWDARLHPRVPAGHGRKSGEFGEGLVGGKAPKLSQPLRVPTIAPGRSTQRFGVPDSLSYWTGPDGKLKPSRAALHARISSELLAGHTPRAKPVATFLGGGPSSGKTSVLGGAATGGVPGAVAIDPDQIRTKLPEYGKMLAAGDSATASGYTHEEASQISHATQAGAIRNHYDYTLDGTGDSSYEKMRGKVMAAKRAGYQVAGKYVTVDTPEAVARAQRRAATPGRDYGRVVAEPVIRGIHAKVSSTLEQLIANDDFDALELWDNNGNGPATLIGEKKLGGAWTVKDEAAWQRFLAKAHQPTPA